MKDSNGFKNPIQTIHDARALQATYESPAAFFKDFGFCLVQHKTQVKDWNTDYLSTDNEVCNIYQKEVDDLLKNHVYNGQYDKILDVKQPPAVLRRGPQTAIKAYAKGVHQDYGANPAEFEANLRAYFGDERANLYKNNFGREECTGNTTLCFWRVTNMKQPLRMKPLALCDPNTVNKKDTVPTSMVGFPAARKGFDTSQGALKYNPNQKWYYYPEMTNDEVLVFKQFEYFKGIDALEEKERTVFHTAFDHPST